jgi:hypothetical protein
MYPFACSKVYDLRQYTAATRWGPFMNDGSLRVDWEKVEAILLVLRSNILNKNLDTFPIFANFWNTPFAGPWEGSYIPWPPPEERGVSELERRDPYDVSGTWLRVVCFLDYNDFFSYNFPIGDELPDNVPRQALDTSEATRLILMKIHVTGVEPPGPEDGQDGPVVSFRGFSRSLEGSWDENADSDLRGRVKLHGEESLVRVDRRRCADLRRNRDGEDDASRGGEVDDLFHLWRAGEVEERGYPDWWEEVCEGGCWELVRQVCPLF